MIGGGDNYNPNVISRSYMIVLEKLLLLEHRAKVSNEENGEHGWVHLRQSIHNPNIAVNLQSNIHGGCQSMARDLRDKYVITFLMVMQHLYRLV